MTETDPLTSGLLFRFRARPSINSTPSSYSRPKPKVATIQLSDSAPPTSSLPNSTLKKLCQSNPVPLAVRAAAAAFRAAQTDKTSSEVSPAVAQGMFRAAEDVYQTPVQRHRFLPLTPVSGDRDELLRTRSNISSLNAADSLQRGDAAERIELFGKDDAYRRRLSDPSILRFQVTPSPAHKGNGIENDAQTATLDQLDDVQIEEWDGDNTEALPESAHRKDVPNNSNPSHQTRTREASTARHDYQSETRGAFLNKETKNANVNGQYHQADDVQTSEHSEDAPRTTDGDWDTEEDVIKPVPETYEKIARGGGEHVISRDLEQRKRKLGRRDSDAGSTLRDNEEITQRAKIPSTTHDGGTEDSKKQTNVQKRVVSKPQRRYGDTGGNMSSHRKAKRIRRTRMNEVLRLQKSLETARWTNARAVREQKEVILISDNESPIAANNRSQKRRISRRASTGSLSIKKEKVTTPTPAPSRSTLHRKRLRSETRAHRKNRNTHLSGDARQSETINTDGTEMNTAIRTAETGRMARKLAKTSAIREAASTRSSSRKMTRASIRKEETQLAEQQEEVTETQRIRSQKSLISPDPVSRKRRRSARISESAHVNEVETRGNDINSRREFMTGGGMAKVERRDRGQRRKGKAKEGEPRRSLNNLADDENTRRHNRERVGKARKARSNNLENEEEEVSSADEVEWNMRDDDWVNFVKAWVVERKVERGGWETVKADEVKIFMAGEFGLGEKAYKVIPELRSHGRRKTVPDRTSKGRMEAELDTEMTDSDGLSGEDVMRKRPVRRT